MPQSSLRGIDTIRIEQTSFMIIYADLLLVVINSQSAWSRAGVMNSEVTIWTLCQVEMGIRPDPGFQSFLRQVALGSRVSCDA